MPAPTRPLPPRYPAQAQSGAASLCVPSPELVAAAAAGRLQRVRSLLADRADPDSVAAPPRTPSKKGAVESALARACKGRHVAVVEALLEVQSPSDLATFSGPPRWMSL